ncbi:hypothetical protein Tco_0885724 [Tanacetum coccineum]
MGQMTSICDMVGQYMQKKEEDRRIAKDQAAKDRYWKIPICYDDDEDDTIAVTPVLSTEEPVDSLIMEDEHLDTILATESDEVIKSSVENLIPIPSESEGILDSVCDVPLCNNPTPLEAFKEHSEIVVNFNDDSTSSDDDSPYGEDIDYVDASPLDVEIVSLEEVEIVVPEVGEIEDDDEHLDTILETESDELIKSIVKDLIHTPSESDGISEGECDLPVYDDFSPKEDEVLDDIISIPPGNGNDHFNAESSLIESVLNRDNVISSPKIDFLIEEFASELALIAPIPPGIVKADLDPKEDIRFIETLMYDNSFPHPPETLKDDSETVIDSNNDYFLSDDNSYENIEYVDTAPPDAEIVSLEVVEIVIPEVGGIDDDILLTIKDDILRENLLNANLLIANIEALKDNPTPSSNGMTKSFSTSLNLFLEETNTFDNSLTKSETFCFNLEEISSGSTTTRSDLSLPDYKAVYLDNDHIEDKNSGTTITHADFSQYDSFIFDLSINPFPPPDRSDFYHEEFADELAHIISPSEKLRVFENLRSDESDTQSLWGVKSTGHLTQGWDVPRLKSRYMEMHLASTHYSRSERET